MSGSVINGMADLRAVIETSLGGVCSHDPVCDAVHRVLDPESPASDFYCCRRTGSLCEAIYDAYYDVKSGDRAEAICGAVQRWISTSNAG
jgi:hypothetical protein